jgi:competence protein ComEC
MASTARLPAAHSALTSPLGFLTLAWAALVGCATMQPEPLVAARAGPAVAITASAPAPATLPSPLEVHFIDVGTGDCIWIRTGDDGIPGNGRLEGLNIVIDGGDSGQFGRVRGYDFASAYLEHDGRLPLGSRIDWLILTHPHSDHCGGLAGFLEDYDVAHVLDPGHDKANDEGQLDRERPTSAYGRFFKAASTEVLASGEKAKFDWGVPTSLVLDWGNELDVRVLWSSKTIVDDDLNNTSIVLRLGFTDPTKTASFLFTGDAEKFVEHELVSSQGTALKTKVLKAGHHGSDSSTTVEFLRAVQPEHVVISSGNQSFSGVLLPKQGCFDRIAQVSGELGLGTQVWRTDRDDKQPVLKPVGSEAGDDSVIAITDGGAITVRYASDAAAVVIDPALATRCQGITAQGNRCKRKAKDGSAFCWQHGPTPTP